MFRQRRGISPTALLIGSSLLIAALSPEIRRKISGMMSGQMHPENKTGHQKDGSMQPAEFIKQAFGGDSRGQQHQQTNRSQHQQSSSMQPAEFIKQAFGGDSDGQQHQHASQAQHKTADTSHKQSYSGRNSDEQTGRRKEPAAKPHYTEPIHFDESAVNVLNDSTVMNMLEDLEPGTH